MLLFIYVYCSNIYLDPNERWIYCAKESLHVLLKRALLSLQNNYVHTASSTIHHFVDHRRPRFRSSRAWRIDYYSLYVNIQHCAPHHSRPPYTTPNLIHERSLSGRRQSSWEPPRTRCSATPNPGDSMEESTATVETRLS